MYSNQRCWASIRAQFECVQARVKFHVLLTTYEMVGSEISTLRSLEYETLIVDEGHRCD